MIKKYSLLTLLFFLSSGTYSQSKLKSLLAELDQTIERSDFYMKEKELKISQLKHKLKLPRLSVHEVYDLNTLLCNEYRPYKTDSAIRYIEHNLIISETLKNKTMIAEARLQRASLYAVSGMYIKAEKMLKSINSKELNQWLKADYYQSCKDLYSNIATYNSSAVKEYDELSTVYRDSLLNILDNDSKRFHAVYAEKLRVLGRFSEARKILLAQLDSVILKSHEHAMVTSALGILCKSEGNKEMERMYFAISAISDIENAVKENTSLQALAISLYEMGDLDHAYKYIKYSMDDAIFCNAPLRTLVISKMFPIIDAAHQAKIAQQKRQLWKYLILISFLSVCLIVAVVYALKQMKKIKSSRLEITHANLRLKELNQNLQQVNQEVTGANNKLLESNRIKEEYIGNFLDLCSNYVNKLEDYRRLLNKRATSGKTEELFKMLRSSDLIDEELKLLYRNFDDIFLHLYPDFVEQFNGLLVEGEQFLLKPGELNTELRIFALVRLGIQDGTRISEFLRCSMSTIYNYRTKVRNKAAVPREEFDRFVLEIGTISNMYQVKSG
ncbi:DUF6377 domain-containing protein [Pedobacter sp. ASV1-7]|uniref:DUF6377 domain-containing protein n=1 Tax=Pedobacter sp. ASV1-7 TaxID=3145237 RepID=UPI0032E8F2F4